MTTASVPQTVVAPPFTLTSALRKVRMAEDAWNSRDPKRVALAYSEDSVWRNRSQFLTGRSEIRRFLKTCGLSRTIGSQSAFNTNGMMQPANGTVATAMSYGSLMKAA